MYTVQKDDFVLTFKKEKAGVVVALEREDRRKGGKYKEKHIFSMVNEDIYKLRDNKWDLLDTDTLRHQRKPENNKEKAAFNLIEVLKLYPIHNAYLKLEFDELFFLQALAYDLANDVPKLQKWLPIGNYFLLYDDELESFHEGWHYVYKMPRALGVPMSTFLDHPQKLIRSKEDVEFEEAIGKLKI